MEFSGEELTFKRIFNYIFGLFLITLGVAFSIKSGLGSTPVASIPYALNLILKWDLGITTFIFQIFLVFLELILLRNNFKRKHFLQVFVSLIFGVFTQLFNISGEFCSSGKQYAGCTFDECSVSIFNSFGYFLLCSN